MLKRVPLRNLIRSFLIDRILLVILCCVLASGLGWAIWSLPDHSPGLSELVASELGSSGVENPVTGVLLDFRAYDTLLEIGVLLLAMLFVWAVGSAEGLPSRDLVNPLLQSLVRILAPCAIIVAGYLIWVGKDSAGGAFQAGAVLGAFGVLLILAKPANAKRPTGWVIRMAAALALLTFIGVAAGLQMTGRGFLDYPVEWSDDLILLIEIAVAVSTSVILVALFWGGPFGPRAVSREGLTSNERTPGDDG